MNKNIRHRNVEQITLKNYTTVGGACYPKVQISYQIFGKCLGTAPVVLVNHALTGNSNVAGKNGWWKEIVGTNKAIDTSKLTVIAFNIPGNGFDEFEIENYKDFITKDIAQLFLQALKQLKIYQLHAIIGGSLGGAIAWEMAQIEPSITKYLIPVSSDWKSTDWMIANCQIQEQILNNSSQPIHDARMHAMLCYRTPESFKNKFNRSINEELNIYNIESWLLHHGKKLQKRFKLKSYKLMNQLLKTIGTSSKQENAIEKLSKITAEIHMIGINSDLYFTPNENIETLKTLSKLGNSIFYHEINSQHGHDAFLIEFDQLEKILSPIIK